MAEKLFLEQIKKGRSSFVKFYGGAEVEVDMGAVRAVRAVRDVAEEAELLPDGVVDDGDASVSARRAPRRLL